MYIVGFIDDDKDAYEDYRERLKRKDIELLYPDYYTEMMDIVNWVLTSNIKCLMVDYKLKSKFKFFGTELVAFINVELPDLPCLILTNYPEQSINENLVISNLIEDRDRLAADDIDGFVARIKQAVDVFENRLQKYYKEYNELLKLKKEGNMSAMQEERFLNLYKLLRAYGEVDDLPVQLLNSEVNKKIEEIIGRINILVDKAQKRE